MVSVNLMQYLVFIEVVLKH